MHDKAQPQQHPMSETTKKQRAKSTYQGGLEGTLDSCGSLLFLTGLLLGIWVLGTYGRAGFLVALGLWILPYVLRLILRALAESIRLQKKALGLPYGGKISEAKETVMYACSECGAMLHSETRCDSCERRIEGSA